MRKITLVLFAIFALSRAGFSQATVSVEAPIYDGYWSALLGPNGYTSSSTSYQYNRACYLVTQAELTRLIATNSVVTDFGFDLFRPGNTNVAGNFTLYLENTSDVTYSKGTTFSSIITGMSTHYSSALTLTGTAAAANSQTGSITMPLSSSFTYTGGGIYVAWEWVATVPTATNYFRYLATYDGVTSGATAQGASGSGLPAVLTTTMARPTMRFKATNTATNEISIEEMFTPGAVSKLAGSPEISAVVRNNGINTKTNIPITLTVTGANPYTTTTTINSLAAGSTVAVNFTGYNPTSNGTSTVIVTAPADQYTLNNLAGQTQSASCSDYANHWILPASSFTSGNYGYGSPNALVTPYIAANTTSITEIKFVPSSGTVSICGILLDASGNFIAATNTLTAATPSAYTNSMKFTPPVELSANTTYFYGVAQLAAGFIFATQDVLATTNLNLYYQAPVSGGAIGNPQNQMGYVAMQAVTTTSNLAITASASQSLFCKGDASTLTLNAQGSLTTYTWSRNGTGGGVISTSSPSANVTPTIPASVPSGTGTITYSVMGTDGASGCKSNGVTITVTVSACTALADNNSDGYNVNLYPNPAVNGFSNISGLVGTNEITIYNMVGQMVQTVKTDKDVVELNLAGLPSGNYIVKITGDNKQTRMVKLMK